MSHAAANTSGIAREVLFESGGGISGLARPTCSAATTARRSGAGGSLPRLRPRV